MTAKKGTYLIEFWNGQKFIVGNNYKTWWIHAIELANDRYREVSNHQMFKSVHYSRVPFVDNGGLKYCAAEFYQEVIDEVEKKRGEAQLPFELYKFEKQNHELAKLDKELERW